MSQAVLLLGSGGLLGSAVRRGLAREQLDGGPLGAHEPITPRISWSDPAEAAQQFRAALAQLVATGADPVVVWAAGAGIPSSPPSIFEVEQQVFAALLEAMTELFDEELLHRTRFFLASSAGAVYAGVEAPPYDESSPVRPLAPYGHAKLALEAMAREFAERTGVRVVCGRFSNLYGPGQNLAKAQGLVSVLLANALNRRPSQIYVSLDTIRDYIYVDDAAALALACVQRLAAEPAGCCVVKVLASGQRLTIGNLLGLTRQTIRRRPLVVQGASPYAKVQARDLSMQSRVWPEVDARTATTIVEGMHRTWCDLQTRHHGAA